MHTLVLMYAYVLPLHLRPPSIKFDHGSTSGCPVCSTVAASFVAVQTDVGVMISVAKVAFVCGLCISDPRLLCWLVFARDVGCFCHGSVKSC